MSLGVWVLTFRAKGHEIKQMAQAQLLAVVKLNPGQCDSEAQLWSGARHNLSPPNFQVYVTHLHTLITPGPMIK